MTNLLYIQMKPNEQKTPFSRIAHVFFGFDSEFLNFLNENFFLRFY